MKAGIVTFFDADNFGALLQAFALQETLLSLGCDAEFLHLPPRPDSSTVRPEKVLTRKESVVQAFRRARRSRFEIFREKYLHRSGISLENADGAYDFFLAGSDQVWNYEITGISGTFFLDFASSGKRNAYAASFGLPELPEKVHEHYRKNLSGMHHITVREKSGLDLIRSLGFSADDICVMPDPTLLLPVSVYLDRFLPTPSGGKYVLVYLISYDEELLGYAEEKARELQAELHILSASFMEKLGNRAIEAFTRFNPEDFCREVSRAEYVVANSFHAAVFSLLFHRSFRIFPLAGMLGSRNGRMEHFFQQFQLPWQTDAEKPDWKAVDERVDAERLRAIHYLKNLIQEYR